MFSIILLFLLQQCAKKMRAVQKSIVFFLKETASLLIYQKFIAQEDYTMSRLQARREETMKKVSWFFFL